MELNSVPQIGNMISKVTSSSPAKVILFGEHAVVYGYPALVSSIGLYSKITIGNNKKLNIDPPSAKDFIQKALNIIGNRFNLQDLKLKVSLNSEIPIGCGLGSSASVAVSLSAAFIKFYQQIYSMKLVDNLAYEIEKLSHANPSGVDIAICTNGGLLWYRKESEYLKVFCKIKPKNQLLDFYLINTGRSIESTKEMVLAVGDLRKKNPKKVDLVFKNIESVTRGVLRNINGEENSSISDLIKDNERCLEEIKVVSLSTSLLINKIKKIGGAAKVSGGGGLKGPSGIILVYHPDKEKLIDFVRKKNLAIIDTKFGVKGVQIEKEI